MAFKVPEKYRLRRGQFGSDERFGNNGAFFVPRRDGAPLKVIASDGLGWEHVSVSLPSRCPTWEEMCKVRDLFWGPEDCVVQYHPPHSDYVNNHPFCLHLWRPVGQSFPMPPSLMVGYRGMTVDDLRRMPMAEVAALQDSASKALEE